MFPKNQIYDSKKILLKNDSIESMEKIHSILSYSYAPLNLVNYIETSISDRHEALKQTCKKYSFNDIHNKTYVELSHIICSSYFNKNFSDINLKSGFNTYSLIGRILQNISKGRGISRESNNIIDILQKRFEVNHRIFDEYDQDIHKSCNSYKSSQVYALFSFLLSLRFLMQNNMNDLNTVIKLNDVILKSGWKFKKQYEYIICISICVEQRIIQNLLSDIS